MKNSFKEKIAKNEKPIGTFTGCASPAIVECLARTGMDYIIIDNEHSPVEAETSAELARAADAAGICPLARVREISRPAILKLLDVGIKGLIVPNVNTVSDVYEVVEYAKFPPLGKRGYCPSRKDGWGFDEPACSGVTANMQNCNEETLVIPQCETTGALENIEEIAGIDGVDGIFIGPFDLSISMGIPGDFENPVFKAALERILKAAHDAGKICMLFTGNNAGVISGFKAGYDSMTYSLDAMLFIQAVKAEVDRIREEI